MRLSSSFAVFFSGLLLYAVACSSDQATSDDDGGGNAPSTGGAPSGGVAGSLGGVAGTTAGVAGTAAGVAGTMGGTGTTAGGAGPGGLGGVSGAAATGGAGGNIAGASGAGTGGAGGDTGGASGASTGGAGGAGSGGAAGTMGGKGGAGAGGAGAGGKGGAGAGGAGAGGKGGAGAGGAGAGGKGGAGSGGTGGSTNCMTPPAASTLVGWATVNEMNQNGTTGGGNGTPVVVTTTANFNTQAGGTAARVIYVSGNLSGNFSIGSNKTVVGVCGATLQGHVSISNASNVIVRNIKVVGNNCTDSPSDCSAGADAFAITNNSHHVWIDHLDVSDGSDGNLDTNAGADLVTISWTKFSYSTRRTDPLAGASGHRFSNLVGSADTVTTDRGHLRMTWHHNWWAQNVDQRMPRTRFGSIHVFNNLYTATGNSYCTNAGIETHLLVENNAYIGVNRPLAPDANGDMLARGNLFTSTTGGGTSATGTGFTPPYQYTLDATTNLQATVQAQAGPH